MAHIRHIVTSLLKGLTTIDARIGTEVKASESGYTRLGRGERMRRCKALESSSGCKYSRGSVDIER